MNLIKFDNLPVFSFKIFEQFKNLVVINTTRKGGFSNGPYSSLNLSYKTGDKANNVDMNRLTLRRTLEKKFGNFVFVLPNQMHSDDVKIVTERDSWAGWLSYDFKTLNCDALITKSKRVALCLFSADCPIISLYNPKRNVIALIHNSWRGSLKEISKKCVNVLIDEFRCNPQDIFACISPSINLCCYEVKEDFTQEFKKLEYARDFFVEEAGKTHFNLPAFNRFQLIQSGIKEENIEMTIHCTKCDAENFYSFRRDGEKTGRHCLIGVIL